MIRPGAANLGTVRVALGRIEDVLRDRPDIRDRTAAFLAGELPGVEDEGMGPMRQISIWVRQVDLEKADALVPRVEAAGLLMGTATRSDVLRFAVVRGLGKLEEELPEAGPGEKRKPSGRGKRAGRK